MDIRTSVLCLLVTCCCCIVTASRFNPSAVKPVGKPPNRYLNPSELIAYYGYKSREYTVETEDGYILPLLRMGTNTGTPVIMINGLAAPPEAWLVYGPYHSLPYVLHDLGYDIWFPAKRGIDSKHKTLNASDPKFWDFSHDEIGMYDVPPQIDLVMQVTGHHKLLYIGVSQGSSLISIKIKIGHDEIGMYDVPPQIDLVMQVTGHHKLLYIGVSQGSSLISIKIKIGHDEIGMYDVPPQIDLVMQVTGHHKLLYIGISQGSSIFLSLCSLRPKYCDLFLGSVQIAPAMNMPGDSELSGPSKFVWDFLRTLYKLFVRLGIFSLVLDKETFWRSNICVPLEKACFGFLKAFNGVERKQIYKGWLNYLMSIIAGGGVSVKQGGHYIQMAEKGGAPMYDYGPEMNMEKYGQPTTPRHNLSTIKSPTLIIYALDDYFIPVTTVKRIAKEIGENAILYPAKDPTYGHITIAGGANVYKQYFAKIVDFYDTLTGMQ